MVRVSCARDAHTLRSRCCRHHRPSRTGDRPFVPWSRPAPGATTAIPTRPAPAPTIPPAAHCEINDALPDRNAGRRASGFFLHRTGRAGSVRVRALIRRGQFDAGKSLTHGGLRFDLEAHRLFHNEQPVELSVRELAVLELLLWRQGQVVTKEQMVDRLFGWGDDGGSNAIEVYVHRVRKKLEPFEISIRTVRGMGYLLEKSGDA